MNIKYGQKLRSLSLSNPNGVIFKSKIKTLKVKQEKMKKVNLKDEQFDTEDFKFRNINAMVRGMVAGTVIGFFIVVVALVKHFFF